MKHMMTILQLFVVAQRFVFTRRSLDNWCTHLHAVAVSLVRNELQTLSKMTWFFKSMSCAVDEVRRIPSVS